MSEWKDTLSIKSVLIVLIVVIIIAVLLKKKDNLPESGDSRKPGNLRLYDEVERQVRHTVEMAGYNVNYRFHNHASKSFTRNKQDVHVCMSCVMDSEEIDRATYVGLHEVAHTISKSQDHTPEWENILRILMYKAAELGYLDPEGIMI